MLLNSYLFPSMIFFFINLKVFANLLRRQPPYTYFLENKIVNLGFIFATLSTYYYYYLCFLCHYYPVATNMVGEVIE